MALADADMLSGTVTLLVDRGVNKVANTNAALMRILPWAQFTSGSDTEPKYMIPTLHALGLLSEDFGPNFARVAQEDMRHTGMPLEPASPDNGVTSVHFFGDI
jgi:hypothetical protein